MKKILNLCAVLSILLLTMCACNSSNPGTVTTNGNQNEEIITDIREILVDVERIINDINLDKTIVIEPESTAPMETESSFPSFDKWIDAENSLSERYMYETIIDGFLIAEDEISRGWVDEGTESFIRLIKGNTIPETATAKELVAAYKSFDNIIENTDYCIRDFFTVDSYGDAVNSGIYKFLVTIDQLEDSKFGSTDIVNASNGTVYGWDFSTVGGRAAIAHALGVSEELILIFEHAAIDAGFKVTFED